MDGEALQISLQDSSVDRRTETDAILPIASFLSPDRFTAMVLRDNLLTSKLYEVTGETE